MRFEGGRVRTTCWSRTTTHTMATLDTRGLVEAPIWFTSRLPPPLRRYTSAARSAWNAASVQAQRAVSGQARARAQRRGRNGEGATTRAQRHAEEGSRPVLSRLPLARPHGRLLQRTSPSETSWTTLTDPADSHRLAETLADSAHAYSHHCAHRYARGVVVYVP